MRRLVSCSMAVMLFGVAGCSNMSSKEQTILSGGAIGAGAGAVVGALTGMSVGAGVVIGAAAGAATGYIIEER